MDTSDHGLPANGSSYLPIWWKKYAINHYNENLSWNNDIVSQKKLSKQAILRYSLIIWDTKSVFWDMKSL